MCGSVRKCSCTGTREPDSQIYIKPLRSRSFQIWLPFQKVQWRYLYSSNQETGPWAGCFRQGALYRLPPFIWRQKADEDLQKFKNISWEVFSKHAEQAHISENVSIIPVDNSAFIKSLASCSGIICGAGFKTPSEALFLKKKLLVIPMKNQYEQHCNAAALKALGVPVMKNLKERKNWTLALERTDYTC